MGRQPTARPRKSPPRARRFRDRCPRSRRREEPGGAGGEGVPCGDGHLVDARAAENERGHVGEAQDEEGQELREGPGGGLEVPPQQAAQEQGAEDEAQEGEGDDRHGLGQVAEAGQAPGDEGTTAGTTPK